MFCKFGIYFVIKTNPHNLISLDFGHYLNF
jgi:hypothetical protein